MRREINFSDLIWNLLIGSFVALIIFLIGFIMMMCVLDALHQHRAQQQIERGQR